jgi:hypothetical protein
MAHTFVNIGFETGTGNVFPADSNEEFQPLGWTLNAVDTAQEFIDFNYTISGDSFLDSVERFWRGWGSNEDFVFDFDDPYNPAQLNRLSFGTGLLATTEEGFETEWSSNEFFDFTIGSIEAMVFDSALTPQNFEDMEEGWSGNENAHFDWTTVTPDWMEFDSTPQDFEDFEEEWGGFDFSLAPGELDFLDFNAGANAYEDFESTNFTVYKVVVAVSGAGNYNIEINGRDHIHVSPGAETLTQVRDALIARVAASPEAVTATPSGSNVLFLEADVLPPSFVAGVSGPGPNDITIIPTPDTTDWVQRDQMPSF